MGFKGWVNAVSGGFAYLCFNWASMVAPIPSLWALVEARGWSVGSVTTAIVLEMMGFGAGDSLVRAYHYKTMPRWIANGVFGLYVVAVEGVILGYKTVPVWVSSATAAEMVQAIVPIFFPLFTIAGALMASVLMEQAQEDGRRNRKQDAKDEIDIEAYRVKRLGGGKVESPPTTQPDSPTQPAPHMDDTDAALLKFYQSKPGASQREAAAEVGVSQKTVSRRLSQLESAGAVSVNGIVKVNGGGA